MTPSTVFKLKFMGRPLTIPTAEASGQRYVVALPMAEALLDTEEKKSAFRFISRFSPATGSALQDFVKRWKLEEDEDDVMMVRSDGLWTFLSSIMLSHKKVSRQMRTDLFDLVMEQITCDTTPGIRDGKRKKNDHDDDVAIKKKRTPPADAIVSPNDTNNELVMYDAIFNARTRINAQEQAARTEALKDLKREEDIRAAARASKLADLREELRIRMALAAVGDSAML
jgi:hypothetical protein